jgi:hypothetical protein
MTAFATAIALGALLAVNSMALSAAQAADTTGCTPQEQLDQTKGVICPPDVDPAMKAPTPKTGDRPAIPPPGGPGGNPNVQPK